MEDERCRRRGTNWRCKEKAMHGKSYCEKHHLYSISRIKLKKTKRISGRGGPKKCDSTATATATATAAVVEPYRPVIDFRAAAEEEGWKGGAGNDNFAIHELGFGARFFDGFGAADQGVGGGGNEKFAPYESGFGAGFFGSFGAADHGGGGNDNFILNESDLGTNFFDSFGAADQGVEFGVNENFALGESGFGAGFFYSFGEGNQGFELGGEGGHDKFALGEPGGRGSTHSGWSGNDDCVPAPQNREFNVLRNDVKCEEMNYLGKNNVGELGCGLFWQE